MEKMKIRIVWMSWMSQMCWNLWGFTKFCFSFLSWKTKKFYSWKNIFLAIVSKYAKRDPKDGVCCLNFQWRFYHQPCHSERREIKVKALHSKRLSPPKLMTFTVAQRVRTDNWQILLMYLPVYLLSIMSLPYFRE